MTHLIQQYKKVCDTQCHYPSKTGKKKGQNAQKRLVWDPPTPYSRRSQIRERRVLDEEDLNETEVLREAQVLGRSSNPSDPSYSRPSKPESSAPVSRRLRSRPSPPAPVFASGEVGEPRRDRDADSRRNPLASSPTHHGRPEGAADHRKGLPGEHPSFVVPPEFVGEVDDREASDLEDRIDDRTSFRTGVEVDDRDGLL